MSLTHYIDLARRSPWTNDGMSRTVNICGELLYPTLSPLDPESSYYGPYIDNQWRPSTRNAPSQITTWSLSHNTDMCGCSWCNPVTIHIAWSPVVRNIKSCWEKILAFEWWFVPCYLVGTPGKYSFTKTRNRWYRSFLVHKTIRKWYGLLGSEGCNTQVRYCSAMIMQITANKWRCWVSRVGLTTSA